MPTAAHGFSGLLRDAPNPYPEEAAPPTRFRQHGETGLARLGTRKGCPSAARPARLALLSGRTVRILENLKITELIDRAPWREAVTYRDTWPH